MSAESQSQWYEAKIPPPVLGLAGLFVQHRLAPERSSSWGRRGLGLGVAGVAAALMGSAATAFRRHRTTVHPLHPEQASHLVVEGPNAVTRNPMYVGMAIVMLGLALILASPSSLVMIVVGVLVIDRFVIRREEAYLEGKFGEEYRAYRGRVRRWL